MTDDKNIIALPAGAETVNYLEVSRLLAETKCRNDNVLSLIPPTLKWLGQQGIDLEDYPALAFDAAEAFFYGDLEESVREGKLTVYNCLDAALPPDVALNCLENCFIRLEDFKKYAKGLQVQVQSTGTTPQNKEVKISKADDKPRKELIPQKKDSGESLSLIYEIVAYYKVKYLDELPPKTAWGRVLSGDFKSSSNLIEEIFKETPGTTYVLLKQGKIQQRDFCKKYGSRFKFPIKTG